MAAQSIFTSIKKVVGVSEDDDSFDVDLLMHINSVFSKLNQLGIGPEDGFEIEDSSATWADFLGTDLRYNFVKTYVYLSVRFTFDPPSTSFGIDSMKEQIRELEWRINVLREGDSWVDPTAPAA